MPLVASAQIRLDVTSSPGRQGFRGIWPYTGTLDRRGTIRPPGSRWTRAGACPPAISSRCLLVYLLTLTLTLIYGYWLSIARALPRLFSDRAPSLCAAGVILSTFRRAICV